MEQLEKERVDPTGATSRSRAAGARARGPRRSRPVGPGRPCRRPRLAEPAVVELVSRPPETEGTLLEDRLVRLPVLLLREVRRAGLALPPSQRRHSLDVGCELVAMVVRTLLVGHRETTWNLSTSLAGRHIKHKQRHLRHLLLRRADEAPQADAKHIVQRRCCDLTTLPRVDATGNTQYGDLHAHLIHGEQQQAEFRVPLRAAAVG